MVTFNSVKSAIEAATKEAKKSTLRHQCGAALLLRGKVIAVGYNQHRFPLPMNKTQCLLQT